MAKNNNGKIVRYRRPLNINVGMIVFAIIFVYMVFSVSSYLRKDKVQFYEVVEGGIVDAKEYTGIVLREEQTLYTDRSGYVNYYIREGKRAAVGTRIYSIDETGRMKEFLESHQEAGAALKDDNLLSLKKQLSAFSMGYRDRDFSRVYDMQYSLEAAVLEYANFNALDNLEEQMAEEGITFQQVKADKAGVVSYAVDGFESYTPEQISAEVFNRSGYEKAITKAGKLIESGAPVYKIVTSDAWSLMFPLSEEEVAEYTGQENLKVSFSGYNLTATGAFSLVTGTDGKPYGKLDFNQFMVQFISERYLDFEVVSQRADGLKIPESSVTTKSFYLIPTEYLTQGGDTKDSGFLKEIYQAEGNSVEFVPATLYYESDGSYYIDMGENSPLKQGDYVVKPDSTERYQIGPTGSLQGVYNINKGYAVFRQIEILKTNDEYYTVKKGTKFGLSVYDHIVLDAKTVYEGALIYQ